MIWGPGGGKGEPVVFRVGPAPSPWSGLLSCCQKGWGWLEARGPEHPCCCPLCSSPPSLINPCPPLVSRCCTCTVTLARCPSAVSVQWAGTGATASSTSRRRCRTLGHSPSSCWPTPSRAARQSRLVFHLFPLFFLGQKAFPFPLPFRWHVQITGQTPVCWGRGTVTQMSSCDIYSATVP